MQYDTFINSIGSEKAERESVRAGERGGVLGSPLSLCSKMKCTYRLLVMLGALSYILVLLGVTGDIKRILDFGKCYTFSSYNSTPTISPTALKDPQALVSRVKVKGEDYAKATRSGKVISEIRPDGSRRSAISRYVCMFTIFYLYFCGSLEGKIVKFLIGKCV